VTAGFAAATAVRTHDESRYSARIAEGWDIVGNANGGYLLSIAARAMAAAADRPDPLSITAHYLAPGRPGPGHVTTSVVRSGRRFSTVQGRLHAAGRDLLVALGTFGDLSDDSGEQGMHVDGEPPELPDPEDCHPVVPAEPFPPPFMGHVELRMHPDDAGFLEGRRSGRPLMRGWFRLPDDEQVDTIALLTAVDAFPPTIFNAELPVGWTPTLELTAHIRARPAPGWLACRFATRFVTGGFLEADGEIWDRTGRLVAQSRQLALVPRPHETS
jgi:acyl-CoA thioesterase